MIRPAERPISATIAPPGSKSITNRALVLAALAGPVPWAAAPEAPEAFSLLRGALRSEDTDLVRSTREAEAQVESLRARGIV